MTNAGDSLVLAIVQRDWGDDKYACNLGYILDAPLVFRMNQGPGFYLGGPTVWLYDEFEIDGEGKFVHNILFNTGLELEVRFREMRWFKAPILADHDF